MHVYDSEGTATASPLHHASRALVCAVQFNALKDYEAFDLHRDYHHLTLTDWAPSASSTNRLPPRGLRSARLTPGTWYIGVANAAKTVLSSSLATAMTSRFNQVDDHPK